VNIAIGYTVVSTFVYGAFHENMSFWWVGDETGYTANNSWTLYRKAELVISVDSLRSELFFSISQIVYFSLVSEIWDLVCQKPMLTFWPFFTLWSITSHQSSILSSECLSIFFQFSVASNIESGFCSFPGIFGKYRPLVCLNVVRPPTHTFAYISLKKVGKKPWYKKVVCIQNVAHVSLYRTVYTQISQL